MILTKESTVLILGHKRPAGLQIDLQLTTHIKVSKLSKSMSPKNIAGIKAAKQIAIEATKGTALVSVWNRMMNDE